MSSTTFISQITEVSDLEFSTTDRDSLARAFKFGKKAHDTQVRANGDSYFEGHCVPVSIKAASLSMPVDVILASLLHDTIEDTGTTHEQIDQLFGKKVADLVEGVSKLGKLKYQGNKRHVESLRKFFVAVAKDPLVIVIKLCDRWHNLSTLEHLPQEKQQRIALESIEIHAQLASRLNMGQLVAEINDLAFPFAYPEEYEKTLQLRESQLRRESDIVKKMYRDILQETTKRLGQKPHVDIRVKSLFSLFKKLEKKSWSIDEVYDIIALRVIVDDIEQCYTVLGAIHSHWKPVPGRVKDYIAMPKPNGYQSLHTSVFSGSGPIVEIQIRTMAMHQYNEYGVASHHNYKEAAHLQVSDQTFSWLEQLGEFQENPSLNEGEYLGRLKSDFFHYRIFCMTPKGDVIDLPEGATVLDFAYAVHSEIGASAVGGKVDGKYVALKTELHNQQIVEVLTDKKAQPSEKWLEWVHTSHAKEKIKRKLALKKRQTAGLLRGDRKPTG